MNSDASVDCVQCGTSEFKETQDAPLTAGPSPVEPKLRSNKLTDQEFIPLSPSDRMKDLVVLKTCRTLLEAEMILSQLESAGIYAFIPDQFLMQAEAFNLNTFGYVRIQVSPKDYEAAKAFLLADA
jgi:hypothetical protein